VVLLVGARLNWLLSHGKGKTWGEDKGAKQFIQIDISPTEIDSNVAIAAPLIGDIGSCVAALLEGMGCQVGQAADRLDRRHRRAQGQEPLQDGVTLARARRR
jgi:thiamine pyrophosphate-dependent acetolactate synthase large subunit-like protein